MSSCVVCGSRRSSGDQEAGEGDSAHRGEADGSRPDERETLRRGKIVTREEVMDRPWFVKVFEQVALFLVWLFQGPREPALERRNLIGASS